MLICHNRSITLNGPYSNYDGYFRSISKPFVIWIDCCNYGSSDQWYPNLHVANILSYTIVNSIRLHA